VNNKIKLKHLEYNIPFVEIYFESMLPADEEKIQDCIYANPQRIYATPERIYATPERIYATPERIMRPQNAFTRPLNAFMRPQNAFDATPEHL
jgi:hypothetical protein